MNIFIAGAGEVGTHLAKLLSTDNHDITLMDLDPERVEFAYDNSVEIMPVVGDPTSVHDLAQSGAGEAELFISVTPEESMNIVSCILASKLGAKKTLARINNNEYFQKGNKEFFEKLGIDAMVYPERLAAQEIVAGLLLPWTRQYWSLFGGNLNLIAVKMEAHAPLVGKRLKELRDLEEKLFHIVAIRRQGRTHIPSGEDDIRAGDTVFFTCSNSRLESVRKFCGKEKVDVKKVIMMGGSRIAIRTAELLPIEMRIKIIERNHDHCLKLTEQVRDNTLVIHGDGRDPKLLKEEGLENSQAFLALTDNSEANMLATMTAKRMGVYRSVARIENIDYLEIAEQMDIGILINKKLLAAGAIFRHLLNIDVHNVKCLSIGKADVIEVTARPSSKITKAAVKDISFPKGVTLGALMRDGKVLLIDGDTVIQPNDIVMVFLANQSIDRIKNYFE